MKVALSLVRFQPHVRDEVVIGLQMALDRPHPVQDKVPGPLGLPVRSNVDVYVLVEAVLGPVIDAGQDELGRLRLGAPHVAHHRLHGCQRYWLGQGCAGK